MQLRERIEEGIGTGAMSGRLWLYSNYHCNLACHYCLTESSPTVPKRILPKERMTALASEAKELGFTCIGITGGEPFIVPWLVDAIEEISSELPLTVLTNGTLFVGKRLDEVTRLGGLDVRLQISLDRPNPIDNDAMRGPHNFAKVVEAIPKLIDRGIHVRIASTIDSQTEHEKSALEDLVASLGVAKEDHVLRVIVDRGRAGAEGMGVRAPLEQLPPELTITTAGAFYSPYAPTYQDGKLQKDLLLTQKTNPLRHSAHPERRLSGRDRRFRPDKSSGRSSATVPTGPVA